MANFKMISANSHIVEPPDLYADRIDPKLRNRAPRMERRKTPAGREYDAWMLDGQQVGTLGAVMQAGQRFEDPSQIDFLGIWEDVRKGAYDPHAMIVENEQDGIWGSVLQPSQGLFWYRIPDTRLLSEICRAYNDWIADFCKPYPDRLKGIAMLNVDDPDEGAAELERVAKMGLVGSFIPVAPRPDKPYSDPAYDRFWAVAEELKHPLLLAYRHAARRDSGQRIHDGRDRTDRRRAFDDRLLGALFARLDGVRRRLRQIPRPQDRLGRARGGVDPALAEADGFHLSRTAGLHKGLALAGGSAAERLLEAQHVRRVHGGRSRRAIARPHRRREHAVGQRLPARRGDLPALAAIPQPMFDGVPEADLRKITSENAAKMFGFQLN